MITETCSYTLFSLRQLLWYVAEHLGQVVRKELLAKGSRKAYTEETGRPDTRIQSFPGHKRWSPDGI
jgi:hypothetical protein